ncbi:MAG TPA: lysophospholipid acyltransferase family protein [Stellaceae bacterium]|nr:lysophospholipid acyltransferase family protein [Stellaceae bacterium]
MRAFALRSVRLLAYLALTLPLMPVQALLLFLAPPLAVRFPRWYHRLCWRILGFRVEVRGAISERVPTLFVSNHVSYLDITILGGLIRGSFVAKMEVARWPLFGQLARLQRTVFVERRAAHTVRHRNAIAERLAARDNLILFPEGTSGDGNRLLPFRSGLFSAAETKVDGASVAVQPVSIGYVGLNGMPMGRFYRPFFAWYGDMEMAPHLWTLLGLGTLTVVVEFHPVVTLAQFGARKVLAEHCRRAVAAGLAAALSGREAASGEGPRQAAVPAPADLLVETRPAAPLQA